MATKNEQGEKRINAKRIVSWVGSALMLASLGFIGRRLFLSAEDVDFSVFANPMIVFALLSVALLEGVGIVLASVNYRALVANVSGVKVKWPLALVVYTMSNLYKYIPGGVMYVLGRNKMAVDTDELSHAKVALSTVMEGIFIALAAVTVAAAFSWEHSTYYLRQQEIPAWVGLIAVIVVSAALPILFFKRKALLALWRDMKRDAKDLRFVIIIRRFVFALVLMILWAFTFLAVLMLLGQEVTAGLGVTIMGLYMLSWLAGFITPGAPSGLGVREAVMVMFMAGTVNEGILISAMVMHRVLTVVGDVSAYGMALAYAGGKKLTEREA